MTSILPWEREDIICTDTELLGVGITLMRSEANELLCAAERMDKELVKAARAISRCSGRVVVVGMGKAGHVARKMAATLSSLGTPSFFLHAAEASHGDLGMVRRGDVGIFVSNSGTTEEILAVLPHFKRLGAVSIAVTGGKSSPLAQHADILIDSGVSREADPLELAPTSSTTLQLVIGDALAGMVAHLRGVDKDDFATFHPAGALGRRLLTRVCDVMGSGDHLPCVLENVPLKDALFEITQKKYGATCVLNKHGGLAGIFTDGDLRRVLERHGVEALNLEIEKFMIVTPSTIAPQRLAVEAVKIMEDRSISVLIVMDGDSPVGMIHFHELLRAGVV